MIEVTVLVPVADNGRVPFDAALYTDFEAFLVTEFGGFSKLFGTVRGGWTDPATGTFYPDEHYAYVVALGGITAGGKVRTLADAVKVRFAQLDVYVRYLGLSEIL